MSAASEARERVDPADVVHRRGRWWPPNPHHDPPPGVSDHGCARGWLAEDDDGRPIPCPTCKPRLAARERRGVDPPTAADLTEPDPTEEEPDRDRHDPRR